MLSDEPLISLTHAAARFPGSRGADRVHPATLSRWILKGVRAVDGRRVKLDALRVGSRWLTSEAALARFAEALGPAPDPDIPSRSPSVRRTASDRAAVALERMGG